MDDKELIETVAVKVMGWHADDEKFCWLDVTGRRTAYRLEAGKSWKIYWSPLTDMNHAWMVVERMRDLGFNANIDIYQTGMDEVEFYQRSGKAFVSCKESIGHAICLAALEAKRGMK